MAAVCLATEDELSEAVGRRLLSEAGLEVSLLFRQGGAGYLRKRLSNFVHLANTQPILLLTDLDTTVCPSKTISSWFGRKQHPENLLFRVAVREVEAWLLADFQAMGRLLGSTGKIPLNPESLQEPKETLLTLARSAPAVVRNDLVARTGAAARQGIGYNNRLSKFVETDWSPHRASSRSASLTRARQRIQELTQRL